jgi:hypothetical protein
MKKVLWVLCGAVLLSVALTAPALARPFYQSDLVCDVNHNADFDDPADALTITPFTRIGSARDLYVKLHTLPPALVSIGDPLWAQITCGDQGSRKVIFLGLVGTDGAGKGKLVFVSGVGVVPTPCSNVRVDILNDLISSPPLFPVVPPSPPTPSSLVRICTEGF